MAPRTPMLATCATALVSGLLALTTGMASTPSASPLPHPALASATSEHAAAALHNAALHSTALHNAALHNKAGVAKQHPVHPAQAAAAAQRRHTAAQRVRLSGGTSDEALVGRTSGATSGSHVLTLRETALASLRRKKAPTPTSTPTATPTATPTVTAAPSPTADPSPSATATAAPSPTATVPAAPVPTATTSAAPAPTSSPTASPSPASTLSPSGQSAPVGDLSGWRQTYVENFGSTVPTGSFPGPAYSSHWDVYDDGWKDTSKNGTYMPSKVMSVHNGLMDYYIHSENGVHMVSAPWVTTTKGQTYGRYSVRFKADALPGYKTAWLLWPDSESWPADGEIDFPEGNLGATDHINAFAHHASSAGGQDAYSTSATFTSWHTATVEWAPGKITFYLDGAVIGTSTKLVPTNPMHWVLQTETNLDGYAPSSTVAGHVYVDWVSVWSKA